MQLPRLFARAKPDPDPTPPQPAKRPRGSSGRAHTGGFLELEELNLDLQGEQGLRKYDEMYRTDPDVRRVVEMVRNPIVGGTWIIEPHGGDEATDEDKAVADELWWALTEHMRPTLKQHISEALMVIRSGFTPFEQIWSAVDYEGRTILAPRKLALILPRSVQRWPQDAFGDLAGIEQWTVDKGAVEIPRRDLVYYRVGAEGDNWEGISLLRPVYKPWYIKDNAERIDAIGLEIEAMGIPVAFPPTSATPDDLDDLEEKLQNMRAGEQRYIIMPGPKATPTTEGWEFEVIGFGASGTGKGGGRSAAETLKYHSDKIAAAFVAEFMRLGQAGEGARATADVQQDPFHAAVEVLAGVIEDELNDSIVRRYCDLNHGKLDGYPRLKMAKADATALTELATFAKTLYDAGMLNPDDGTEDWFRELADMPAADPKAREERKQIEAEDRELTVKTQEKALEQPAAPPPRPKTAAAPSHAHTFARQQRELRWWEQHMSLDAIEASIDEARARFEVAGGEPARAAARALAEAVAEGRDPDLTPPDELVDALHAELVGLYATGRDTVRQELARQASSRFTNLDSRFAKFARGDAPDNLAARAYTAAMTVMQRIWQRIMRRRHQGYTDPAELQTVGEQEAAAALRAEAQVNAAPALNEGRSDEADDQADRIQGTYYTNVLDGNTCGPCKDAADDDVLRKLDDPIRLARKPPNPLCEGGDRCRCMESFVLDDEQAPSA